MVAALLLLLVPLRSLTRPPAAVVPAPSRAAAESRPVDLELLATTGPTRFSVTHLGRVVWSGETNGAPATTRVALPWPAEGVDLGVEASWPGGGTGALRLTVTSDDANPQERTAWGDGSIAETFSYR